MATNFLLEYHKSFLGQITGSLAKKILARHFFICPNKDSSLLTVLDHMAIFRIFQESLAKAGHSGLEDKVLEIQYIWVSNNASVDHPKLDAPNRVDKNASVFNIDFSDFFQLLCMTESKSKILSPIKNSEVNKWVDQVNNYGVIIRDKDYLSWNKFIQIIGHAFNKNNFTTNLEGDQQCPSMSIGVINKPVPNVIF